MLINKSKTYLTYYINKFIPIKYLNKSLLNTYLAYEGDETKICILYEFSGKKEFTDYEAELERNEFFHKTVDVSKKHVLYVFNIPAEIFDAIKLFKNGKYSELPEKRDLIKFLMINYRINVNNDIIKILNKDPELKARMEQELDIIIPDGMDLSSIPNMNNENFIKSEFNV